MNKARVESVLFQGSKQALKSLILQWNLLPSVDIKIIANDYVGGSFDSSGSIEQRDADHWVANALKNVDDKR